MPKPKREVESALRSKGFQPEQGDHHFFIYVTKAGKKSRVRTKTSHTPKMRDISDGLLSQMAKQCKLSKPDFLRLVECPLNRDGFEELLSRQGEL